MGLLYGRAGRLAFRKRRSTTRAVSGAHAEAAQQQPDARVGQPRVAALQRTSSEDDSDSHFSSFGNLLWSRIITLPTGSRFTPTISAMAAAAAAAVRALLAARCSVATRWTCGGF